MSNNNAAEETKCYRIGLVSLFSRISIIICKKEMAF